MTNESGINTLLERAKRDYSKIEAEYQASLTSQSIGDDLKVDIKNLLSNLRSVLDYIARDVRGAKCNAGQGSAIFYFPILNSPADFANRMATWFPGLQGNAPDLWDYLEALQPYMGPEQKWLAQFNSVNNDNKHQELVEQKRVTVEEVKVSNEGGSVVTWNPSAVTFGHGVHIGGVPVDPQTQLPVPSPSQQVTRTIWVDFQFGETGVSAIWLLEKSVNGVCQIAYDVRKML